MEPPTLPPTPMVTTWMMWGLHRLAKALLMDSRHSSTSCSDTSLLAIHAAPHSDTDRSGMQSRRRYPPELFHLMACSRSRFRWSRPSGMNPRTQHLAYLKAPFYGLSCLPSSRLLCARYRVRQSSLAAGSTQSDCSCALPHARFTYHLLRGVKPTRRSSCACSKGFILLSLWVPSSTLYHTRTHTIERLLSGSSLGSLLALAIFSFSSWTRAAFLPHPPRAFCNRIVRSPRSQTHSSSLRRLHVARIIAQRHRQPRWAR
mmetsp:Transcript_20882/g.57339  ORF Transcript_20882/g.57339 Transcript_20882/m.57339 type:complete len:259 (-) Transcript_20882:1291-2067(-)